MVNSKDKKVDKILEKSPNIKNSNTFKNFLDNTEQIAKIISLIAIPIIISLLGWSVQNTIAERSASQQYVALAVSILTEPKNDPELRSWAVKVLNANSPIKLSLEVEKGLASGEITLPIKINLSCSPNNKNVIIAENEENKLIVQNISQQPLVVRVSWDYQDVAGIGEGEDSIINGFVTPGIKLEYETKKHTSAQIFAWDSTGSCLQAISINIESK